MSQVIVTQIPEWKFLDVRHEYIHETVQTGAQVQGGYIFPVMGEILSFKND
jgi:hypothetical protein